LAAEWGGWLKGFTGCGSDAFTAKAAQARAGATMSRRSQDREQVLAQLDRTIGTAVEFFGQVDETLFDGNQTAREVLSHLVFWHREYVKVSQALLQEETPCLHSGTFTELNELATREFAKHNLLALSQRLTLLQQALSSTVCGLPDWQINFPVKQGSRSRSVADRLPMIDAHICNHVKRLERACRLGAEWVNAYYAEKS
jgi:hypothetical protein